MTLTGFADYVKKKLSARWAIKQVSIVQDPWITKEILRISTNLQKINQGDYLKLIGSVLTYLGEFPQIAYKLQKIVFLDKWEKRGWTFKAPERHDEISRTAVKKVESVILSHSRRGI